MNKKALEADALLFLTAAIWGLGFVAQRSGMEYIGPFAFNGIRFILGSLSLFPLILWRKHGKAPAASGETGENFRAFLLAGGCLFIGVTLQQIGIMFTSAGNAGFITGLYVILTPFFGMFLGRKTGPTAWIGAVLTLAGLYFISIGAAAGNNERGINPGDIIVGSGAVFWAFHVLLIDRLVKKTDPIVLSSGQFIVCGIFSLWAAFFAETFISSWLYENSGLSVSEGLFNWYPLPALLSALNAGTLSFASIKGALIPVLYGGLASVGVAYTLQTVAQRDAPPAHATIILCFEGSFAAAGGVIILEEALGPRTIAGFALMLAGMAASQWRLIFPAGPKP